MVRGEISIASYSCNGLAVTLQAISIACYNFNGLADYKKRRSVFTWLKEKEYNIYCLQETHSSCVEKGMGWINNFLSWTKELKGCDDIN